MKGLSEVVGSLLLVALTLGAFALIWPWLSSNLQGQAATSASYASERAEQSEELLSPVYFQQEGDKTIVYAYNYGNYPFTAKEALVAGHLVKANGTVDPGYLAPIEVFGVGSSITIIGVGGVEFTWQGN
ncbi:MAG: hypothetical protein ACP5T5_04015 [Thermoprotei archaeon]|nr:hypothetical protein [TACK group archaeon]